MLTKTRFVITAIVFATRLAGQEAKTLRPDEPVSLPPAYRNDSLAMRFQTDFGRLEVMAERSPSNRSIASGKYYVRLDGKQVAIADNPSLTLGAPSLAGYYPGDPAVVLLSTYTGGNRVPGYFIKIILLKRDVRGTSIAGVYSLGGNEDVSSDRFRLVSGPTDGRFTLSSDEYTLTYSGDVLRFQSNRDHR